MVWQQIYDPFGNPVISTLMAAVPVVVMLAALAFFHVKAHLAALLALASALLISIFAFGMPASMAGSAALFGAANGLLPIGWIVLNIIFLHRLTTENGSFKVLQDSLARITDDRRLQLLLIAFCFGAFFEGAAGFGTPVAVTGAILIGLGFSPLAASGLALIANTAPVAFGALGTPIITLAKVTGLDEMELSMMVGRQLPFFSVLVPFWLIWAFAGWRKMLEVWPAILVAGVSFAVPQFLVSNYHGPMLVDVIAALISMACLTLFLKVWKPATIHTSAALSGRVDNSRVDEEKVTASAAFSDQARPAVMRAWMPWFILTVFVFAWGTQGFKNLFDTRPAIDPVTQSAKLDARGQSDLRPGHRVHDAASTGREGAACGACAENRRGGLQVHLVDQHRQRNFTGGDCRRSANGLFDPATDQAIPAHAVGGTFFADHHRGDAGTGVPHALLRPGRNHGPGVRGDGDFLPDVRHPARLARGGTDRLRHRVQRAVRRTATGDGGTTWHQPGADGSGQQFRWGDGQNGRCAVDCGRIHGNPLVWA